MTLITVEVAYATPDKQHIARLSVEQGTTAREAAERADLGQHFEGLQLTDATPLGVFGKAVRHDTELRPGDRVEIYRPLIADPKEARRQRALRAKGEPASP